MTTTNKQHGQRKAITCFVQGIVSVMLVAAAGQAQATQVVFTIDSSVSNYSITGTDNLHGAFVAQGPGGAVTPVKGHFLVDFDPSVAAPPTLTFLPNDGYLELNNSGSWLPGPTSLVTPAPANIGLKTVDNAVKFAVRDLAWDWSSGSIPIGGGGSFDETLVGFQILGGAAHFIHPNITPGYGAVSYSGSGPLEEAGAASLVETSPGQWSLVLPAKVTTTYGTNAPASGTSTIIYGASIVAKAQFGTGNITPVTTTGAVTTAVAGGAAAVGGIDLDFDNVVTGGTLTAQVINDTAGLTLPALEALGNFQLPGGGEPQIWNLDFDGTFSGTATLVFNYDPDRVGSGNLSIIHYNETLDAWENLGGIVDTMAHTITVETTSFSPFAVAPEPSSLVLAAMAACVLAAAAVRRRKK